MSPLAASLVFVFIAIAVSIFRHIFFQPPSLNAGDDINVSLTKLHSITIQQHLKNKTPYNSLYEAFYKPQQKKQFTLPMPYNSFVLKKSILNNEGVYICDEKFTAIFEEKTSCGGPDNLCKWRTTINVYPLPYLKKQEEKTLQIEGRVLKSKDINNQIKCIKKQLSHANYRYELNFVMLHRGKQSKKGAGWTMNSLIIQQDFQGWRRNGSFTIKMMKWNLKNVYHYPILYSFDDKCLSYITQQQPWLIYFNCGQNWTTFNVLHPKVQNTLFIRFNSSFYQTGFSSTHHVNPLFLQLFKSTMKLYSKPQSCTGACPLREIRQQKVLITYVFQIANSPIKFGNTIAQLTIAISQKTESKHTDGLVSYNIISNEINPEKRVFIDCNINTKEYKFIKGLYSYQIGLETGEDHTIASIDKHSLVCICSYNYVDSLRIIQIEDLLGNLNLVGIPSELLVRTRQQIQQIKLENILLKRDPKRGKEDVKIQKEDQSWFDFGIFDFTYSFDQEDEVEEKAALIQQGSPIQDIFAQAQALAADRQKKQKKVKQKTKRQEKKKSKKLRRERRGDFKLSDDAVGYKLDQLGQNFFYVGHQKARQASIQIIQIPMPFALTSQSKIKVLNGDLQLPLIYIQTNKKFLLTYQQKEAEQKENPVNKTKAKQYTYKYSQLGTTSKSSENYFNFNDSLDGNKTTKKREEFDIDMFLLQVLQYNSDVLNQVKSITVVDARYDEQTPKLYKLKGLVKPFRKHVIVVWGWGIQVYEVNWDRKNIRNQLAEIEVQLNSDQEGIEMMTIIPFIQLFATVFCLFQTLISTR